MTVPVDHSSGRQTRGAQRKHGFRGAFSHLRNRPILLAAIAAGCATAAVAAAVMRLPSAILVGWDVAVLVYVLELIIGPPTTDPVVLRHRAELLDQGRWTVLIGVMLAVIASFGAIGFNIVATKGHPDALQASILAAITVILSWAFVHIFFAQQYMHGFWIEGHGLVFPGTEAPDFYDFLYLSFTVGMTAQVSDVTTCAPAMRRLILAHSILSFLFNTAVLAGSVNLMAGLFA